MDFFYQIFKIPNFDRKFYSFTHCSPRPAGHFAQFGVVGPLVTGVRRTRQGISCAKASSGDGASQFCHRLQTRGDDTVLFLQNVKKPYRLRHTQITKQLTGGGGGRAQSFILHLHGFNC